MAARSPWSGRARTAPCLTWFEAVVTGGPGATKPVAEPTSTRSASSRSPASHDQSDIQGTLRGPGPICRADSPSAVESPALNCASLRRPVKASSSGSTVASAWPNSACVMTAVSSRPDYPMCVRGVTRSDRASEQRPLEPRAPGAPRARPTLALRPRQVAAAARRLARSPRTAGRVARGPFPRRPDLR
jgi:hypothetical protein